MHTQLKLEYDTVKELRGLSGFGWNPKLCTVIADPDVWIAYIKVSPDGMLHSQDTHEYMLTELQNLSTSKAKTVKTFCTKPFPLFNTIGDLVDGT